MVATSGTGYHAGLSASFPPAVRSSFRVGLLFLLAAVAAGPGRGQALLLDPVTRAQGSPSDYVSHVIQDRAGFLWLATDAGLVRYDGREFVTWTTADGLPHNYVNTLHELPDGRILVGTFSGAAVLDRGRLSPMPLPRVGVTGVATDRFGVTDFASDRFGRWYAQTGQHIYVCDDDACRILGDTATPFDGFFTTPEDLLAIRLPGGRLLTIVPGPAEVHTQVVPFVRPPVTCSRDQKVIRGRGRAVLRLPDGTCLGVSETSIRRFDGQTWTQVAGRDELGGFRVQTLMLDYEGNVWVGLFGGGLWRLGGQTLRAVGRSTPGLDVPILRLYRDPQQTLWMSTRDGLIARDATGRLRTEPLGEMGLAHAAPGGGQYRATATALSHVARGGRTTTMAFETNWFSALLVGPGDTLWTGSYGSGVRRFFGTREVGVAPGGPAIVEALVRGDAGAMWALTRSEGAFRYRDGSWTSVRDGLPSASIYSPVSYTHLTLPTKRIV